MVQNCPHCQAQLDVSRFQPGQTVTCYKCKNTVTVTGGGGPPAPPPYAMMPGAPPYPPPPSRSGCGTAAIVLVVLLVVAVPIIAIIAAIAIPGLLRARVASNETAAIGTLRTLATSQAQFQSAGIVDQDEDGVGEFGFLQELAGTAPTRGSSYPTSPAFITSVLGSTAAANGGMAEKSGYHFQVFLPDGMGGWIPESSMLPGASSSEADGQEEGWICYAWPADCGNSGNRAFVVTQSGQVFSTGNKGFQDYDGTWSTPEPDAALVPDASGRLVLSAGQPAGDGNVWVPAGN